MKKLNKLIGILLSFCIVAASMLVPVTASADESGTYGDNITWTLIQNGVDSNNLPTYTLTMSGYGDMESYFFPHVDKWAYNNSITNIVIENGITSIGGFAFYCCDKLTSITIPNSVTFIGERAFDGCESLTSITIPSDVALDYYCFDHCQNLKEVTFVGGDVSFNEGWAFEGCPIETISVPATFTADSVNTFKNILSTYFPGITQLKVKANDTDSYDTCVYATVDNIYAEEGVDGDDTTARDPSATGFETTLINMFEGQASFDTAAWYINGTKHDPQNTTVVTMDEDASVKIGLIVTGKADENLNATAVAYME